jgi:peroxiredoxin
VNAPAPVAPPRPTAVRKRDPVVMIVAAMLASLLLVFGVNFLRNGPTPEALAAARMKGQPAHEFMLPATNGKTVHLSDFHGHPVVINFWATWCEPCKTEMPWFAELQRHYAAQGLQILGVDMHDDAGADDVAAFARERGIDYTILVGSKNQQDTIAIDYGVTEFLPQTVFIAADGKVSEKTIGLRSESEIERSIRRILPVSQAQVAEKLDAKSKAKSDRTKEWPIYPL